jgi:hypothetical protein
MLVSAGEIGWTDKRREFGEGATYDIRLTGEPEATCCSAKVSACGEGGEEEHFDVGTVKLSVSEVREVRVEIMDAREPSRRRSKRECSLEATEDSIGDPVVVPTRDWTSSGKLASFGELPGVLCGER